ncbi:MAG: polyprenol monophosphomannose synthase [Chloroflexota bacterium]
MPRLDKEMQQKTAVPQEQILVSLVIPTRNEAKNIVPLLRRLSAALSAEVDPHTVEVLFVDDSTDDTPAAVTQAAADFPFTVRLIARPPERRNGLSGAVVEGFSAAQGTWLCVMDADLQHPPELVPALLARAIEARADIVVGSRKCDFFGPLGLSRKRAMTSQLLTLLARAWFPRLLRNVSDPLTGLFLVRRAAVDTAVLRPNGFKILLEILIRCPGLRVSEIFFDFASRHQGESKADFQEGMNFFRHLLRLRLTANQSFPRLVLVALLSLGVDTAVIALGQQWVDLPYWATAILFAQLVILLRFWLTEQWVLGGGHPVPGWPSLRRFWVTNQFSLLLVRLPLLILLISGWNWSPVAAILLAVLLESVARYTISEQWVFSRRGMTMWQPGIYRYNLHGILRIESQTPLPELAHFHVAEPLSHVDIQIRVDRFGTPTPQPGAILYNERLSRFGFGMVVLPGDNFSEIVISPLLGAAPFALYKSVVEPVLRWALVQRGYVLIYGGSVAQKDVATLIVPEGDEGKTEAVLQATRQADYAFMSDDFAILAGNGRLYSFPKPITVTPSLLRRAIGSASGKRGSLWLQNLLYWRVGRRIGLQLSQRGWPVATLNILWQRLWLPPKWPIQAVQPDVRLADSADLQEVVLLVEGSGAMTAVSSTRLTQFVIERQQAVAGFPPYKLLLEQLADANKIPLAQKEQALITQALRACTGWSLGKQNKWPPHGLPNRFDAASELALALKEN